MQIAYKFSDKIVSINSLSDATNAHKEEMIKKNKSQARDKEAFKKEFEKACKERKNDKN